MKKKTTIIVLMTFILLLVSPLPIVKAQQISDNEGYITYRVVSGDSLWSVAQRNNTTVNAIKSLNGLTSDIINVNQLLKLPSFTNVSTLFYTVHPGDTLWDISQRTGTSVSDIVSANQLSTNMIYVGQMLNIHYRNPVPTVNYRVLSGDTMWGIAQKYNTSSGTIIGSNFMQVNYLMPGQLITVPINTTQVVKPVGITLLRRKSDINYGDIYTWDNARRLFTVGTEAVVKDVATGASWKVRYYGGSNHADVETLTSTDTDIMYRTFGERWSWTNKRPIVIHFTQAGIKHQIACSLIGMPHATNHIVGNGMDGHCCLYFYNSVGHSKPEIDPISQGNILKANGQ